MEREAKFIVPDQDVFARLRKARRFGPYARSQAKVKQVHDRYVDTEGHSFYKHQLFARLRVGESEGTLLTLKRLGSAPVGAIHQRDEYQVEVPGLDISQWPEGDVRRMAQEIAGDLSLGDLFTIDQTRHVSVLHEGARALGELSLDEVEIGAAGGHKFYEMEIELLPDGTMADLHNLSRLLTDEYHLAPQPLSKFERAMSLVASQQEPASISPTTSFTDAPLASAQAGSNEISADMQPDRPEMPLAPQEAAAVGDKTMRPLEQKPKVKGGQKQKAGVLPTDSMATAGRKLLRQHFEAMLENEKGTGKGDDVEALHDMRVATRRMRATLRAIAPYVPGKQVGRVERGVRPVTHALGAVRDLDVLIDHAEQFQGALPPERQHDIDGLLADWRRRRKKGRNSMLRMLASKEYRRFKKGMEEFLAQADTTPDQLEGARPYQVRHVAGSTIIRQYEKVRAYETLMADPTIAQLHALRIAGKYLRYSLELFREVLPGEVENLIADVTKMQDQLGALHDADVAAGLTREYLARSTSKQRDETPEGLAAYLAEREGAVRRLMAGFGPTWAQLNSPQWRKRLAETIAEV